METDGRGLISPTRDVSVVEGELVASIRELAVAVWKLKAIARTVGLARNTVWRYLQPSVVPGVQTRPAARRSSSAWAKDAEAFRKISFARFSSKFSRPRSSSRWCSSVVTPGRFP